MEHLKHLAKIDSKMNELIEKHGFIKLEKTNDENYLMELISSIVSQQLSVKVAKVIWDRFSAYFNNDINPNKILEANDDSLRELGLSYRKISYIKNICEAAIAKTIDFDNLDSYDNEFIIDHLVQIKGIGRWTAEMFLIFSLKRENVFSYGDLGLVNAFKNVYGDLPKEDIIKIVDSWAPYQTYASLYLWKSLDNKPK